jgi:DNA polymerase III subunit alpha
MYLIFDTETTGLPRNYNAPISDTSNWPRVVQIAWQLHEADGTLVEQKDFLIRPDGFNIPFQSEQIHGISTELASLAGRFRRRIIFIQKSTRKSGFHRWTQCAI